ncbi:IclR family transcriptional regulator [Kribbella sp. NPDC056861]|uniref:IclR family transcriptional regulator n=1 Tax=Kribbella sp. NPDC056861 TaxID=3154857 RepID=UPI00342A8E60
MASRVLALLGAFDSDHRALTLTDLARRAGIPLATAHRLVAELVEWGALVRRTSGEYVVGRRVWDLGLLAPAQSGLRQVASPFLNDIYGATLATVHLAVRDGAQVLYLDRVSGHASVPVVSQIGSRLPLHATGVGKVLLAYAPQEIQAEVLSNLTRVTPYTITQPGRLREDLRRVHREGYAVTTEEMSLGARWWQRLASSYRA